MIKSLNTIGISQRTKVCAKLWDSIDARVSFSPGSGLFKFYFNLFYFYFCPNYINTFSNQ